MRKTTDFLFGTPIAIWLCCLGVGCIEDTGLKETSTRGRVTLDGTPLQDGVITLESTKTGRGAAASLDGNGEFLIPRIPVGEYAVTVTPTPPPDPGEPPKPRDSNLGKLRLPPEKYRSPLVSDLKAELGLQDGKPLLIELRSEK